MFTTHHRTHYQSSFSLNHLHFSAKYSSKNSLSMKNMRGERYTFYLIAKLHHVSFVYFSLKKVFTYENGTLF